MIALAPDGLALSRPYVAAEDIGPIDDRPISSAICAVCDGRALAARLSHFQRLPPYVAAPEQYLVPRGKYATGHLRDRPPRCCRRPTVVRIGSSEGVDEICGALNRRRQHRHEIPSNTQDSQHSHRVSHRSISDPGICLSSTASHRQTPFAIAQEAVTRSEATGRSESPSQADSLRHRH